MRTILLLISLMTFLSTGHPARRSAEPKFNDYPVTDKFKGKPALPIISQPRARLFQTMIRLQAAHEPNFAGLYTLATWGCGAGCRGFAVIDARTGKVYFNPKALNVATVPFQDEDSLQFRLDSRLLILSGYVDGFRGYQSESKFYYEWKNNRFMLIRKTKIKMYHPEQ
jgi:hypothetical protein